MEAKIVLACLGLLATSAICNAHPATTKEPVSTDSRAITVNHTLTEEDGRRFLEEIEEMQSIECNKINIAGWTFESNITDENQQKSVHASLAFAKFKKAMWKRIAQYPWKTFQDPFVKRQFKSLATLGTDALPEDKLKNYTNIIQSMQSIYSKAKVCRFDDANKCDLSLEPELIEIVGKSRNYDELEHAWVKWREVSGNKYKDLYPQYVELLNDAAQENGFKNAADMWLENYSDSETFVEDVDKLWDQIRPLYEQLHAYVRRQLRKQYGDSKIGKKNDPIPAHLLGNMWAQKWANILPFTTPYPEKESDDVTETMIAKNYTVHQMFKESESFFTSVTLPSMTEEFWANSIIEKPKDRDIVCHASAWDFCDGKDFRIKQCTEVKMKDFIVVHHEMGHIAYYMEYKDQPIAFREGANSGFHEAVGDLLALSVSTPKHLKEIGLLQNFTDDEAFNINYLYSQALNTIAYIPYALLIDKYRWDIFKGKVTPEKYNCHWWKLRFEYQGLRPPVTRKSTDFDAGAKYHVAGSVPYIRYFVSIIIQYQFHRGLCITAGEYDPSDPSKPLHKCDIYKNKFAGAKLSKMLKLGSSKPWPEALEMVAGQNYMDASAILDYYKPLYDWLREQNAKAGEPIGWKETDEPLCVAA